MRQHFQRSDRGLQNTYLFYRDVIVWVEGPDDVCVYEQAFATSGVKIREAGGRPTCEMLAAAVVEKGIPIVVVLDADYDVLGSNVRPHRRVVRLSRYSIENYFCDPDVCEQVARMCSGQPSDNYDGVQLINKVGEMVSDYLQPLITVDACLVRGGTGRSCLPERIDRLMTKGKFMPICRDSVTQYSDLVLRNDEAEVCEQTRRLVRSFLDSNSILHLLRGHLVFGLLRIGLTEMLKKNHRPRAPNDAALYALFGSALWRCGTHRDAIALKRKLVRAANEAMRMRTE